MKLKCFICTVLTSLMLIVSWARADEEAKPDPRTMLYGKVAGSLSEPSLLTDKLVAIGYQHKLTRLFDYQLEGGAFVDNTNLSISPTIYFGPSLGVSLIYPTNYIKIFVGPAYVSHTDAHLSTPFEFHTDIEIGLKDDRGVSLGIGYTHLSNAGIQAPNIGRDFLFFKVGIP